MIFSHKYKFVYLSIPKTGSTSVTEILRKNYEGEPLYDRHDNRIPKEFSGYFVFTTVRNPYDRAISGFKHLLGGKKKVSLDNCWDRFHMCSMKKYLTSELVIDKPVLKSAKFDKFLKSNISLIKLNTHIKLECLQKDFLKLPFVNQNHKFPRRNRTVSTISTNQVDEICSYVSENFQEDFNTFGYDIEMSRRYIKFQ